MADDAPDLLDPRARRAAALLLVAFDLPAPMESVARQALQAAVVDPRLTPGQAFRGDRIALLGEARALIDSILQEAAHA